MGHNDCGANFLEQRNDGITVEYRRIRSRNRRQLRGVKLIEDDISRRAATRPLSVQARLRPKVVLLRRDKSPLDVSDVRLCQGAVYVRLKRSPAPARLVDNINGITLPQKILSPAFAAIRSSSEVRSGLAKPVDHQDGPAMSLFGRNLVLGVNLAAHHLLVVDGRVLCSGEYVTLPRNGERR